MENYTYVILPNASNLRPEIKQQKPFIKHLSTKYKAHAKPLPINTKEIQLLDTYLSFLDDNSFSTASTILEMICDVSSLLLSSAWPPSWCCWISLLVWASSNITGSVVSAVVIHCVGKSPNPSALTASSCKTRSKHHLVGLHSQLKADRPHPRDYPHTPTDYRHTDKHLRLVMTPIALCFTLQSRALNIDRWAPEIWLWPLTFTRDLDPDLWPWPRPLTLTLKQGNSEIKKRFLAFDLDLWPTTLTYNLSLF